MEWWMFIPAVLAIIVLAVLRFRSVGQTLNQLVQKKEQDS